MKPEQIVGRTPTEMAPIEGLYELFDQVRNGRPVVNFPLEGELVTSPGEYRYWTVSYFPIYGPDGQVEFITAASLEVTAQKKAGQALIQNEKLVAVGRLASSIAHEINNPLESVTNLLYLARLSSDMDEVQRMLEMADRELRRVSAIANQTLRFHKQASSPQEVTAATLLEGVLSVYQGRIVNGHIEVETQFRSDRPVRCFEGEIRQVVSNLVGNAIDATPGGRILLRSRSGRKWATGEEGMLIAVADTGSGISDASRKRMFEPFFTIKGIAGTGLGLWVSKEIKDRHRGSIRARSSQSPARSGTVFRMFLPYAAVTRKGAARTIESDA